MPAFEKASADGYGVVRWNCSYTVEREIHCVSCKIQFTNLVILQANRVTNMCGGFHHPQIQKFLASSAIVSDNVSYQVNHT